MGETGDTKKKDTGKLRMDLVPPLPLEKLAEVYGIGAAKYSDNGWLKNPIEQKRVLAALKRHISAWEKGEDHDQVDGQLHMAAVAWGAFTIMHYREYNLVPDDRQFSVQRQELASIKKEVDQLREQQKEAQEAVARRCVEDGTLES